MYLELQRRVREKFVQAVEAVVGLKIAEPALGYPPNVDLGELSITSCFELAKQLRQPPRKIAEQLASHLLPLECVERVSIAGAGYLNLHLDRAAFAAGLFRARSVGAVREPPAPSPQSNSAGGKILVEHTSINPNKAAHIGHLRNAVLGDTFARLLKFRGHQVEIQNYIDNTGVQVADVVVGFVHLERKSLSGVQELIRDPAVRFDYYCWELYARVFQSYESHPEGLAWRAAALKGIEEGQGEYARMAESVSTAIVRLHLETMRRVNVQYDLLVQESEILKLDFWKSAFELMKQKGAIRYEESGKNQGCWVMALENSARRDAGESEAGSDASGSDEDVKVIVRSNGTVTYVGKDIAYHLWKFGLLGRDFAYQPFYRYPEGATVWRTAVQGPESSAPAFGHASAAYAVIDTRQSYVQNVVSLAFRALGYSDQANQLHHLAYEVVGLSTRCAEEMGMAADHRKGYVEVSGRKGLGIKADDLTDRLAERASEEVRARGLTADAADEPAGARMIAIAALRYFLLRFTRRTIIAFDFKEALAFEGETGPYLQYTVVRARNIFRKLEETDPGAAREAAKEVPRVEHLAPYLEGDAGRDFWELVLLASQLEITTDQAIAAQEPALVAKYAFRLAQAFNNFYHHHRILGETDRSRQGFLLFVTRLTSDTLAHTLDLLGIETPERM